MSYQLPMPPALWLAQIKDKSNLYKTLEPILYNYMMNSDSLHGTGISYFELRNSQGNTTVTISRAYPDIDPSGNPIKDAPLTMCETYYVVSRHGLRGKAVFSNFRWAHEYLGAKHLIPNFKERTWVTHDNDKIEEVDVIK